MVVWVHESTKKYKCSHQSNIYRIKRHLSSIYSIWLGDTSKVTKDLKSKNMCSSWCYERCNSPKLEKQNEHEQISGILLGESSKWNKRGQVFTFSPFNMYVQIVPKAIRRKYKRMEWASFHIFLSRNSFVRHLWKFRGSLRRLKIHFVTRLLCEQNWSSCEHKI